jgi:glucose-6-phosphate dehydrogenase assembly protein OpcA
MSAASHPRQLRVDSEVTRAVGVDDIHQELGRVWADISRQVEEQSGQIPLRTSILTLLVVARGASETRLATETLHELVEQMPSRAIVIAIAGPDTPFDATISAHCRYLNVGQAACYEVIELRAPADRLAALPSLLAPLEVFDVPAFLWWVGPVDFMSPEFARLAATVERVIVDTSRFDAALDALTAYHRFLQTTDASITGTDLNWARSTSWRELIAQCFDHPMAQRLLHAVQRVEISFDPSAEAQALLLAGWLATRLGWRLVNATRATETMTFALYTTRGHEVAIILSRQASTGVGLRAVRIVAGSGLDTSRITVRRRSEGLAVVAVEAARAPRQERVVRDPAPRLRDLIGKELLVHTRDRVFDESLDFVASVVHLMGR